VLSNEIAINETPKRVSGRVVKTLNFSSMPDVLNEI
jgi:hypothetical protein